jgi:hypothetical protein
MEFIVRTLCILAAISIVGCAGPTKLGPKPDIKPVIASNERTKESIKKTQVQIKKIGEAQKATGTAIDAVISDLNKLLGE